MNIEQVRRLTFAMVKKHGSQTNYAKKYKIHKAKLSEFLSGKLDYVPSSILTSLGLIAAPQATIYKKIESFGSAE